MRVAAGVVCALFAACIDPDLVPCGNGELCPSGRTCVLLADPAETVCAVDAQIAACTGIADGERCTLDGSDGYVCRGGACIAITCGNLRVDPGEQCDDGNTVTGDGTCSADCLSNERCGNGIVDPLLLVSDQRVPNEQCDDGNLISSDGCSSTCQVETTHWVRVDTGVTGVMCGAMAGDIGRNRIVLFGGSVPTASFRTPIDVTQEWNGVGWSPAPTVIVPRARERHAMAYDANRHRVVMFGGNIGDVEYALGETWEWDGTVWTQRSITGPRPRSALQMVYDGARKKVVLFGGLDGSTLHNDVWEWDGVKWTEIPTTNPPGGRMGHSMAYDPRRNVIVVVGGYSLDSTMQIVPNTETWELAGSTWINKGVTTPPELESAVMAYDVADGRMIAYGGAGVPYVNKTFAYTGSAWQDLASNTAGSLNCAALALEPQTNHVVLFGGYGNGTISSATWRWTGSTWVAPPPAYTPAPRTYASGTFDPLRGVGWVFGGSDSNGDETATMASFDGAQWQLSTATGPSARSAAATAFDRARRTVVMFGGIEPNGIVADAATWLFDGTTWTNAMPVHSPDARVAPGMAYDARRERVVLFGGATLSGLNPTFKSDTWEWDGTDWTEITPPHPPAPRMGPGMVYDDKRGLIVMQQGFDFTASAPTDVSTYDGVDWTQSAPTTPLATRMYSTSTFDHVTQRVISFGGVSLGGGAFSDTWAFDAAGYSQVLVAGPPEARGGAASFPAPDGHGIVIHGGARDAGNELADFGDTWTLRYDNAQPRELCSVTGDNDGDGLSGCADPDCWAHCTPLCPPGVTCDPSAPRCGDGVCNAAIENCRICAADCTCPAACGDSFCDATETQASCPGDCTP